LGEQHVAGAEIERGVGTAEAVVAAVVVERAKPVLVPKLDVAVEVPHVAAPAPPAPPMVKVWLALVVGKLTKYIATAGPRAAQGNIASANAD
jgi:hypothetical protein